MKSGDWFREESDLWAGQAFSLEVEEVLYEGRTMFQEVLVFRSRSYGNVLVLDGVIQATERDEFAYQEMISHIPLMSHPAPKRVLVVGGGDGGCVREVLRHPQVEQVDLVEIDESVVRLAKSYLPDMAGCLEDPKVRVHIEDGFKFLSETDTKYDVIISDTSDPVGPAEKLFQEQYFRLLYNSLGDDGIVSMQTSENVWLKIEVVTELQATCKKVFPVARYAVTMVPTYTSGQLGIMICAKNSDCDVRRPCRAYDGPELRYYTPEIHGASFVLPTFARKYIQG